ncbi:peptidyl-prolyl cis-trans isomerase-like 2 [Obelidium mucronatum]|nr:peptidyl-prolyl cis-trans isomerase-like 2 [Obelidium mucronatum]
MGKDTDKMYITHSEWSTLDFGHGGFKNRKTGKEFKRLPFYCCALSLSPFDVPRCTKDGLIFDLMHILPWIKKHGTNPVTGEPLAAKDLIELHFHKNSEGAFHDPITFKVFTDSTHIVAVGKTGHVYAYETIDELIIKTKSWDDLMTDEPFKRKDLITIQDPHNVSNRDINAFHYRVNDVAKPDSVVDPAAQKKREIEAKINATGSTCAHSCCNGSQINLLFIQFQTRAAHHSFLYNFGTIDVELFCDVAPKACYNFVQLAKNGYYKNVPFHRSIKNFMIQTGDPSGTGRGGQSYYGHTFSDEFKGLSHNDRGLLSMANKGKDTNSSQFFITYKQCKHLDGKHSIFGKITKGIEVLDTAHDKPKKPITMESIEIVVDPFEKALNILRGTDPETIKRAEEAEARKAKKAANEASFNAKNSDSSSSSVIGKYFKPSEAAERDTKGFNGEYENAERPSKKKSSASKFDFSSW